MKITFLRTKKVNYMQIYLKEEELEKDNTKEIIEEYKKKKYNIAIFIAGKENYPEILKKIITKQLDIKFKKYHAGKEEQNESCRVL